MVVVVSVPISTEDEGVAPGKVLDVVEPGIVEVKVGHWMIVSTAMIATAQVAIPRVAVAVALVMMGSVQTARKFVLAQLGFSVQACLRLGLL